MVKEARDIAGFTHGRGEELTKVSTNCVGGSNLNSNQMIRLKFANYQNNLVNFHVSTKNNVIIKYCTKSTFMCHVVSILIPSMKFPNTNKIQKKYHVIIIIISP